MSHMCTVVPFLPFSIGAAGGNSGHVLSQKVIFFRQIFCRKMFLGPCWVSLGTQWFDFFKRPEIGHLFIFSLLRN
jgi:hypothetical protein